MKWFRPAGVVGFAIVFCLVGAFWWMAADWLLKKSIEHVGTRVVGARVELDYANVSFSPFGFELGRMQVTDPDQPLQNLVELQRMEGHVQLWKLMMGQVIVDDLTASGVQFNTARATSGEVKKRWKTEAPSDEPGLSLEPDEIKSTLPSVDEILAREQLVTKEKAMRLKDSSEQQRREVEQAMAALPDEAQLRAYEGRIKELTSGDITSLEEVQQRNNELAKLKKAMLDDKRAIEQARDSVKNAKGTLTTQFNELKEAPQTDLARLRERYRLEGDSAGNITRLLFGETANTWLQTARSWYDRLKGFLPAGESEPTRVQPERGKGRFIHFVSSEPLPDFLVRRARLGAVLPVGSIDLVLADVTHQPHILGRPMTLEGVADRLDMAHSLQIDGVIDHVDPSQSSDKLGWTLKGWQLSDVTLSDGDTLPVALQQATVDVIGNLSLSGQRLDGVVDAAFDAARWQVQAQEGWTAQVANSLATIDKFNLKGQLQGDVMAPDISLRSDLDKQIMRVASTQLRAKQAEFEKELQARLDKEVMDAAGPYRDQVAALTQSEGTLDERIEQLEEMLAAKAQSFVDDQKEELEDKLKGKLKGLGF